MHRSGAWIAWFWLLALAPAAAQSTPLPLELTWNAPPECPSGPEVRAELERIARVRTGHTLRPLVASAHLVRKGAVFRAVLRTELEGRHGARTLEAADCPTLLRGLTLVLALTFGPGVELAEATPAAEAQPRPAQPQPAQPQPAQPQPQPAQSQPTAATEPEPSLPLTLSALVATAANLNLFPSPSFNLAAGLQLRLGAYALELRAQFSPSSSSTLAPAVRSHFQALGGAVSACHLDVLSADLELTSCAGARFAALTARTSGNLEQATATAPWTALSATAAIGWPRRYWLQLRLDLSAVLSLSRPRFIVESLGDVQRVPLFIPELGLSLLVHF